MHRHKWGKWEPVETTVKRYFGYDGSFERDCVVKVQRRRCDTCGLTKTRDLK